MFVMNIASYDNYLTSHVEIIDRPSAWFHVRFMWSPNDRGFYNELKQLNMSSSGLEVRGRCNDNATEAGVGNYERCELSGSLINIVNQIAMEAFAKSATDGGDTINCQQECMKNRWVTNVGGTPRSEREQRGFREDYYVVDDDAHKKLGDDDAHKKLGRMGYILGKCLGKCNYLAGAGQEFRQDEGMCRLLLKCIVLYTGHYPVDSLETIITFWGNTKATNFHWHR